MEHIPMVYASAGGIVIKSLQYNRAVNIHNNKMNILCLYRITNAHNRHYIDKAKTMMTDWWP